MNIPATEIVRFEEAAELIEELLRAGNSVCFKVTGSSMRPAIRPGDVVTVVPCPGVRMRPGRVICFRHQQEMRVHRIIAVEKDRRGLFYLAKGDAVNEFTEQVRPQDVLGVAAAVERGGKPVNFNPPFRRLVSRFRGLLRKMTN